MPVNGSDPLSRTGVDEHILTGRYITCFNRLGASRVWTHVERKQAATIARKDPNVAHHGGGVGLSSPRFGYTYHFLYVLVLRLCTSWSLWRLCVSIAGLRLRRSWVSANLSVKALSVAAVTDFVNGRASFSGVHQLTLGSAALTSVNI